MNNNQQPNFKMPAMPFGKRTSSGYKFLLALGLGVIPMLLCSYFIMDSSMTTQFKQWGSAGPQNATVDVSYGFMWLIGIAVYIAAMFSLVILSKFVKDIGLDTIPSTSAASIAMLNMFVIPHSSAWFLLLSIPSFAIIGFILGIIIFSGILISKMKKEMDNLKNRPEFEEVIKRFEQMQRGGRPMNPTFNENPNGKKDKSEFKDNPFVDIPEDKSNDKKEDENKK